MLARPIIPVARMAWTCLIAFLIAACSPITNIGGNASVADTRLAKGERIYREGLDTTGAPLQAISQKDVKLVGAQAACVRCHRPSGLGSAEGGYYVPPINGPLLFAPRQLDRLRLFPDLFHQVQPERFNNRLHQPHMRPAYTPATLATALRDGIDPAGQPLAAIMPRYALTDADVAAMSEYLQSLSAHPDPGVDEQEIQLATVFSDNVAPHERTAMLETLRAFVDWHNLHLHEDRSRGNFSPYNRSQFVPIERRWVLSVWLLKGAPSTWRAQLQAQYRKRPVFALVGGKVDGSWNGAAQFCNAQRLPCLFPDTDLPAWPSHSYSYTMYFSAGLALEGQVAAGFVASAARPDQSILQLAAADEFGQFPAREFEKQLRVKRPGWPLHTETFRNSEQLKAVLANQSRQAGRILVVWPSAEVEPDIAALAQAQSSDALIVLPDRAIDAAKILPNAATEQWRFIDPYEIKLSSHAKSFETRAWIRTRNLAADHLVLRFKAYYAMSLLEAAMFEISNDFYRDYLLERVEDESQKDLNPGMYPRLALGPGERFAAKTAEVVRLTPGTEGGLAPVTTWIAP